MGNGSEINLSITNDLHFKKSKVCGTQIATNKLTKKKSMYDRPAIKCPKNALDYLASRQRVVASNVANINTPGYKSRDIAFDDIMSSKNEDLRIRLATTHERHMNKSFSGSDGVETYYSYGSTNRNDGRNDVDVDKEMLKLGDIQANYTIFSELLKRKYGGIKSAINGTP